MNAVFAAPANGFPFLPIALASQLAAAIGAGAVTDGDVAGVVGVAVAGVAGAGAVTAGLTGVAGAAGAAACA